MPTTLTEAQCRAAMASGEFDEAVRSAAPAVAVVLTQSWCPQWRWLAGYLPRVETLPGVAVFSLEYDRVPWFEDFMTFKEERFGNREVPYVRYYRQGRLVKESNFIDEGGFKRNLGL